MMLHGCKYIDVSLYGSSFSSGDRCVKTSGPQMRTRTLATPGAAWREAAADCHGRWRRASAPVSSRHRDATGVPDARQGCPGSVWGAGTPRRWRRQSGMASIRYGVALGLTQTPIRAHRSADRESSGDYFSLPLGTLVGQRRAAGASQSGTFRRSPPTEVGAAPLARESPTVDQVARAAPNQVGAGL